MSKKNIVEISLPEYMRYLDLLFGQICYPKNIKYDVEADTFLMGRPVCTSNGEEYEVDHFDPEKNILFLRHDGKLIEKELSIHEGTIVDDFFKRTYEFINRQKDLEL